MLNVNMATSVEVSGAPPNHQTNMHDQESDTHANGSKFDMIRLTVPNSILLFAQERKGPIYSRDVSP